MLSCASSGRNRHETLGAQDLQRQHDRSWRESCHANQEVNLQRALGREVNASAFRARVNEMIKVVVSRLFVLAAAAVGLQSFADLPHVEQMKRNLSIIGVLHDSATLHTWPTNSYTIANGGLDEAHSHEDGVRRSHLQSCRRDSVLASNRHIVPPVEAEEKSDMNERTAPYRLTGGSLNVAGRHGVGVRWPLIGCCRNFSKYSCGAPAAAGCTDTTRDGPGDRRTLLHCLPCLPSTRGLPILYFGRPPADKHRHGT